MNWDQFAGNWKQVRGMVRVKWGKLVGDQAIIFAGQSDILLGKTQQLRGRASDYEEKRNSRIGKLL